MAGAVFQIVLIMYISVSMDGVAQSVAMSTIEENNQNNKLLLNSLQMFQIKRYTTWI